MAQINAAVTIILDEHKAKVYISLRQKFQTYSNYWEFPGGKLEKNETFTECVKREINEEVGITANVVKSYISKKHFNKDKYRGELAFFYC